MKRFVSVLLSFAIVCSCIVCFPTISANSATTSQQNIVGWADYYYDITWTAQKTVSGWKGNYTYYQGNSYRLPYGQPVTQGKYIGYGVSIDDFISATKDANSAFYSTKSYYSGYSSNSVYYATDCSAFVSLCWGIPRSTTSSIPSRATGLGKLSSSTVNSLQIGDCLNSTSAGHVVLVTDVTYSSGTITSVEITEQTPPQLKRTTYSASSLVSYYGARGYYIYRYNGTVPTPPSQEPEDNYVDLGTDFYAMIANNNAGKAVGLDEDCNIVVEPYEGYNDQIWHFIKQSNGGYKIINGYTDTYIVGDNIASLEPEAGNNNKIWYIKQNQSGYALVHYSGDVLKYLHPAYEAWNNGTQMTLNDSAAPLNINFVEGEDNKPTNINIVTNNSYYTENPVKIEWVKSRFANYYNVTIWKDNGEKVVDTTTRNNSIICNNLSTGHYGVYIEAENHIGISNMAVYHFNVISSMEPMSFDAVITNRENYAITDNDDKLCVETYEVFSDQIWQFSFQDDGSYLIKNRKTGEFLSADKDNVYTSETTSTKWFIGNQADKYYLYMVMAGNTYYLKIDWKANAIPSSSSEQSLYYLNLVKGKDNIPQKFDVDVPYGTFSQNDALKITWTESKYSYYYDIEIANSLSVNQLSTTENTLLINDLTEGLYEIKITAVNDIGQYSLEPIKLLIKVVDDKINVLEADSKLILGDVDGDKKVSIMDATEIQRHIAQLTTISEDRLPYADTDRDTRISIMDATQIQRFIAQLIPSL